MFVTLLPYHIQKSGGFKLNPVRLALQEIHYYQNCCSKFPFELHEIIKCLTIMNYENKGNYIVLQSFFGINFLNGGV